MKVTIRRESHRRRVSPEMAGLIYLFGMYVVVIGSAVLYLAFGGSR